MLLYPLLDTYPEGAILYSIYLKPKYYAKKFTKNQSANHTKCVWIFCAYYHIIYPKRGCQYGFKSGTQKPNQ